MTREGVTANEAPARATSLGPAGTTDSHHLDDPARIHEIRRLIRSKPALQRWYRSCYARYAECLGRCPANGRAVELGAGASFVRERLPEVLTTDLLPYAGIDGVLDATRLPFADASLRAILMTNVFHHIADVGAFLAEAERCLVEGGRVFMVEPQPGWISTPIYRWIHHEPFDARVEDWRFASTGPLSSANGALAWMVFQRDRAIFERRFPGLELADYRPGAPLTYFLSGGLRPWSLLPGWAYGAARALDAGLTRLSPRLASFVDVELIRR